MTVERISLPISTKECCRTGGFNLHPPECQSDVHPTELQCQKKKISSTSAGDKYFSVCVMYASNLVNSVYHKYDVYRMFYDIYIPNSFTKIS